MSTADAVITTLETVVDLGEKLQKAADQKNNIRIVFENRSPSHVGTFTTPAAPDAAAQDWEIVTPYLGSASFNQRTHIYEPATAVSVTDVVDRQGLTLNLVTVEKGHLHEENAGTVAMSFKSTAGMVHGQISITIKNAKGKELLVKKDVNASFAETVTDIGAGPLQYSVGWAYNKYILQVTIANINQLY
jgi:hypothetical protein